MPFDSNGLFTRLHNWEDDRKNDIDIVSDRHDEEDDNFADGLSECFLKDGRSPMKGELKMGGFQIRNLANGTISTDAVNKSQLENANKLLTKVMNQIFSVGDIKASLKNSNHDNWFLCNGQAVSRTTYAELFALIGTNFGAGDGSTTFNLPDYRGKFLRGLGGDSANSLYEVQNVGLPNITGSISNVSIFNGGNPYTSGAISYQHQDRSDATSGDFNKVYGTINFNAGSVNGIYGASGHVTPINQAVNYFIKVKEEG